MANGGKTLWKFKEASKDIVVVRPIYSFDNIQILPMQWRSPKALSICIGHIPTSWLSEPVCRQHSDALPFLHGAAKAAFWQLPVDSLKRLATEQFKLQWTGSEVDLLIQLISHVLHGISDNELAEILEQRHFCNTCVCVLNAACLVCGVC